MTRGQTGLGVTANLSSDGVVGLIQSLQLPTWSIEPIDFTNLSDTEWRVIFSGVLKDPGLANMVLYFDPSGGIPTMSTHQQLTITIPIWDPAAGFGGTPGTLIGSGYIGELEMPNAAVNEPMMISLSFQYDGFTVPPSLTPGTIPSSISERNAAAKGFPGVEVSTAT